MNPYWLIVAFTLLTQFIVFLKSRHRACADPDIPILDSHRIYQHLSEVKCFGPP
jgi:hypothetical protein